jgi:alpha-D-ribose 1-methylphosphonate 5-triphosphate synthase subunit PhnG
MLDQNPTDQTPAPNQGGENQRADWMGVLGRAPAKSLEAKMKAIGDATSFDWLRQPEIGAIMLQGRAGGTGAAFNMGEMTVTRCALRLAGEAESVGHGYVQGRDARHAELAALADALLQTERQAEVMDAVIRPLKAEEAAKRLAARRKAGATKVDFFTMVRAEG